MPSTRVAHAFRKSQRYILPGFHYAPLRPSFTSVPYSPPATFYSYARRRPPAAFQGSVVTIPTLIRLAPYATHSPSTVCPSRPSVAFLSTPAWWHSQANPSYVLLCLWASSIATVPKAFGTALLILA